MKDKIILPVAIFTVSLLIVPHITFASWWNPFTWKSIKKSEIKNEQVIIATPTPDNRIARMEKATTTEKIEQKKEETKKPKMEPKKNESGQSKSEEIEKENKKEFFKDCASIKNKDSKDNCYIELARLKKDPSICNMLSGNTGKRNGKNKCLGSFPSNTLYKLILQGTPISYTAGNSKEFSLYLKIKNENVLPFITNFGINFCKITGDTSDTHKYTAHGGYKFTDKALFPGEETTVEIKGNIELRETCLYNEKGIRVCEDPSKMITGIASCDFSVSTDGNNTDGGWGEFWQTLVF